MTKRKYTVRVPLRMTEAMHADLQLVSTKAKLPVAAIIRQAIRNYLDDTDLTLGTRRTFDRRFQRRMGELEDWLILLTFIVSSEFARSHDVQPRQLFDNAVKSFSRYAEVIRAMFKQREGEE